MPDLTPEQQREKLVEKLTQATKDRELAEQVRRLDPKNLRADTNVRKAREKEIRLKKQISEL